MERRYNPHRHKPESEQPTLDAELPSVQIEQVPTAETELAAAAIKKNPKAVLEHVMAAARRKEALERVYELRQEVKDEPANLPPQDDDDDAPPQDKPETDETPSQSAVPIATILSSQPPATPQPSLPPMVPLPPTAFTDTPDTAQAPIKQPTASSHSIYRRAVVTGFATGVVILAAFVLFLVVL